MARVAWAERRAAASSAWVALALATSLSTVRRILPQMSRSQEALPVRENSFTGAGGALW